MYDSLIKDDNIIHNAWQLFIKKGIIKKEVLRKEILFDWERSKLYGADPLVKRIRLTTVKNFDYNITIPQKIKSDLKTRNIALYLISEDAVIIDGYTPFSGLNCFVKAKYLEQAKTGNLSIYQSIKENNIKIVNASEHYLSYFHPFSDVTIVTEINQKRYYLLFISYYDKLKFDNKNNLQILKKLENKWKNDWIINNRQETKNNIYFPVAKNNFFSELIKEKHNNKINKSIKKENSTSLKNNIYNYQLFVGDDDKKINNKVKEIILNLLPDGEIINVNFAFLEKYYSEKNNESWIKKLNNNFVIFDHIEVLDHNSLENLFKDIIYIIKKTENTKNKIVLIAIYRQKKIITEDYKKRLEKTFYKVNHYYVSNKKEKTNNKSNDIKINIEKEKNIIDLKTAEIKAIKLALSNADNITGAATLLGISRSTLYRKISKYGINIKK